jgi:hypothetical protein
MGKFRKIPRNPRTPGLRPNVKKKVFGRVEMSEVSSYVLTVPDDKYDSLFARVETEPVSIADKNGVVQTFYRQGTKLYADRDNDGTPLTQKVIRKSEEEAYKNRKPFKDSIKDRLRKDFPEYDEANLEAHADVLGQANESIKRLIQAGISPANAVKIVLNILDNQDKFESPEQIVELIKEKEEKHEGLATVNETEE